MTNQHLTERELVALLKDKAAGLRLSGEEKQGMRYSLMEQIAISDVTKSADRGYRWWKYQLNFKGVRMPFLPILFAILLAGGVGTAALANAAKPGDPLYGVDQWMEQVQQRLTTKAEAKADLYAKLADERLKEAEDLSSTDSSKLDDKAKALWEEHKQDAIDRLNKSIEQVKNVQDKFEQKVTDATDPEQKAVFQKIVDHLGDVQQKRADQLTKVEDKTSPGLKNNPTDSSGTEESSDSEHQNSANPQANSAVNSQTLEIKVPIDENGNVRTDLIDSDHDGIPDKDDKNPDWPTHTM